MNRRNFILVCVISSSLANYAAAGLFFNKPKPTQQRADELVGILKSEAKEGKRAAAVDELGTFDPKAFPEIVPVLLDALHDASAEVRGEAVQALGKIRPVSPEVGQALEQTLNADASTRVRLQARTTLWHYHRAGYQSPKPEGPQLAAPAAPPASMQPGNIAPRQMTHQEPPLADPNSAPTVFQPAAVPRFAPVPANVRSNPTPVQSTTSGYAPPAPIPTPVPVLQTPPLDDSGPALPMPQ